MLVDLDKNLKRAEDLSVEILEGIMKFFQEGNSSQSVANIVGCKVSAVCQTLRNRKQKKCSKRETCLSISEGEFFKNI